MGKKIYFGDTPLFLVNSFNEETKDFENDSRTFILKDLNEDNFRLMLEKVQHSGTSAGIFINSDENAMFEMVKKEFTLIQAAGGAVLDEENNMLFIFRRGKWDLPKGKLDEGEDLQACATREVEEETGLSDIQLMHHLVTTYHTYEQSGEQILKESFWYLMKTTSGQKLVPQTDEDIEKCEWVNKARYGPLLQNTHASIKDVVAAALPYLDK